jgi:hypothetical protein
MLVKSQRLRLELPTWRNFSLCMASSPAPEAPPANQTGGAGGDQQQTDPPKETEEEIRNPTAKIRALTEEKDRHQRKVQEQETELNELRKLRDEQERAKLNDVEKAKADQTKAETEAQELKESNRRLALQNAFLVSNTVKWHDSAAALKLVDLSEVKVENGEVKNPDALKAAIDKLTTDYPWMVNADEAEEKKEPKPPAARTGQQPANKPPDSKTIDREKLFTKYPALRDHA